MDIVGEHETGRIRVIHFEPAGDGQVAALGAALGVTGIVEDQVQQVDIADLGDMPLSRFLATAYEVEEDALAQHAATLDALTGTVFIIRSSAFADRPVTLNTDGAARLIATMREPSLDTAFPASIETDSAQGILSKPAKKKPSDAAMGGRVATIALLVMALLVWLMIWIAG